MEYKNISLIDVVESFLTGICCLVGGDQLYLFISQTDGSPYDQYNIIITVILITLTICYVFYDEYNEDFINAVQLVYTTILLFLVLILYSRIRSVTIVTLCTIFLSIVLTIFVLSCCISYSINRVLLLTFILGLFGSRLLPTLCWIFIDDTYPNIDTQLSNFALKLYFFRFMLCLLSIIRKIVNNNFGLSINNVIQLPRDFGPISEISFVRLIESSKYWISSILPTLSFFCSTFVYINRTPILPSSHFNYSSKIKSSLSIIEMISNFTGIALGIIYPASITANSLSFYIITFILWVVFFIDSSIFSYYGNTIYNYKIYIAPITAPLVLGYISSYNLGIIVNTTILKFCKYEEYFKPCCGDKINNSCYCKLLFFTDDIHKNYKIIESPFRFINNIIYTLSYILKTKHYFPSENFMLKNTSKFSCSKFHNITGFEYNKTGHNAILILYNKNGDNKVDDCKDIKCCTTTCVQTCNGSGCKCLKLLGVYRLDTITTSSCADCQLTVRLECKKLCCCKGDCTSTGGIYCGCTDSTKCCCLAIGCCCSGCSNCQCKTSTSNDVRIFFGYKTKEKCCIKEIKPNENPKFEGSLGKQNEFYIKNIFISDCCHVDLRIDLQCYMKNSFYRLTGVNYSMKPLNIESIIFLRERGECCNTLESSKCCCNAPLVRLCLKYKPYPIINDEERDNLNKCELNNCSKQCKSTCGCCTHTNGQKCCYKMFALNTSIRSSFYKRMEPVRIKLIIIFWIIFIAILMISIVFVFENKPKKSKLYDLNPIKSFDKISKSTKKYIINYIKSVNKRLGIDSQEKIEKSNRITVLNKSDDFKNMLKLFEEVLDEKEFIKLNKYIDENTNKYIEKSKTKQDISKDDIMWSYCIGLMYSYVIEMYLKLQTYFIRWEFVWRREYYNYLKSIDSTFNNITNKSKCGISIISELNLKEKTPYCLTKKRTISFNNTYDELNRYIDINENETKCNQELPNDINCRLIYFIDRWDHRINIIKNWINNESNLFNWDQFIEQYPYIQKWYDTFHRYLERASNEVQIPENKLNLGTWVFENILLY